MCATLPSSLSETVGASSSPGSSSKRFNIVVVNDFAHVNGGAAQVAISSAAALARRGHNVTFFAAVPPVDESLRVPNLQVVLTGQSDIARDSSRWRAAAQGIWNAKAAAALSSVLGQLESKDVIVHVHGWTKALSSSVIRAALRKHVSLVITLHDYFLACPNGGFFNFQQRQSCTLRPLSASCLACNCDRSSYAQKLWRTLRHAVQNQVGFGDLPIPHFITLSDFSENLLKSYLPIAQRVHRVINPCDFPKEAPVSVADNINLVAVGRLSPEKGYTLLARAAAEMRSPVCFVGEGPSADELRLVNPDAQISGWQSREGVLQHLRSARALVLPSVWYEAQPLVVPEAASLGVPAVVPDRCAARDQIEDGATGLLFRTGDQSDLVRKLTMMMDPQIASHLGAEAYRRYWRNPPTLNRHLDELETCYRGILQQRMFGTTSRQSSAAMAYHFSILK